MMHVHMIVVAIAIALFLRLLSSATALSSQFATQNWQSRWTRSLSAFVVPPLFLLMTAIAVVIMGYSSCHEWEGYLSYGISISFVLLAIALWLYLSWQALISERAARNHSLQMIHTSFGPVASRLIDVPLAFSAQVGLFAPELVVSEGLIRHLDEEHLAAVLAHEKGHQHYRDTFWFLWLGGLRRLTLWLPGTNDLWQELLLLRELRADRWAARSVDTLVLAESLLSVVSMPLKLGNTELPDAVYAGFSCPVSPSRLSQRIDALLATENIENAAEPSGNLVSQHWVSMASVLTPLLTIPFHH